MSCIYSHFLSETSRIALKIIFPAALLLEDRENNGITHLLEHIHFRGNRDFPQDQLYAEMEKLNSPISGETTSQTMSFSFSSPKKSFIASFDLFCSFLLNLSNEYDDFAKEKSVVIREIEEDGIDTFSSRMKKFFLGDHPFSFPIAGTLSGVKKISHHSLLEWWDKIETAENAYCYLSGAIDDEITSYVRNKLKKEKMKHGLYYPVLPDFKIPQRGIRTIRPRWNDENELAFAIYFPKKICSYFEFSIFRSALCGGDGAIILKELREKHALCTGIKESSYYHKDYYILTFSCIIKKQYVSLAIEDIFNALFYMRNSLNENDFLQANAVYCYDFNRFEDYPEEWNDFLFDYFEATGTAEISKSQIKKLFEDVTFSDFQKMVQSVIISENISIFAETYHQKLLMDLYWKLT